MPSQKIQKIDLSRQYPCPCRRRGELIPITLTEAFGCNRCQQIFVVDEAGYCLEQLSTHYPYKQVWRWTGHQWRRASTGLRAHYLPLVLGLLLLLSVLWLVYVLLDKHPNHVMLAVVAVLLAMLPALMVWLAYRR
ncbi:MAG: hypothetical protein ACFBSC_00870 [Microcoleaceae cyanobacterium]